MIFIKSIGFNDTVFTLFLFYCNIIDPMNEFNSILSIFIRSNRTRFCCILYYWCVLIERNCNLSFRGERLRYSIDPLYFFGTLDVKRHNDEILTFDKFLYGQPTSLAGYLVSSTITGLKKNISKEKEEFFQKIGIS